MLKKTTALALVFVCGIVASAIAKTADFFPYFDVDMKMPLPNPKEYIKKLDDMSKLYDTGYESRLKMGTKFKKEFSQTIKFYGLSEGRIKNNYEDELLEILSWLPKSAYQYVGPMLHEVPGMSEKILNMPGIKETKNQFPQDIADRFKGVEDLEFMSPALYVLLMPEIWEKKSPENLDEPEERPAKTPKTPKLPDYLKEKIGLSVKSAQKLPGTAVKKASTPADIRTVSPTLTSPLTSKDVAAFVNTIDSITAFGMQNNASNFSKLIVAEAMLDIWEQEQGTALKQNSLKDMVNPCQRLVLKTRLAGLYNEFATIVVKEGFSPEEWAYTCDKTVKAFRVAEANATVAHAVQYHRRGYYESYIKQLPQKWQDDMYANEAAIIKMYAVSKEDVETVRPFKDEIRQKFIKNDGVILTAPLFY